MAKQFPWKSQHWPPESAILDEKQTDIEVTGTIVDAYSLNLRSDHMLKGRMKNAQTSDVNQTVKAIRVKPSNINANGKIYDTWGFWELVGEFIAEANGGTAEHDTPIPHLWEVNDLVLWANPHIEADLTASTDSTDPLAPGGTVVIALKGKSVFARRATVTKPGQARNTKMKERAPVMVDDLLMGLVDKHPNSTPQPKTTATNANANEVAEDEW